MTAAWAMWATAQAGPWLLLPLGIATGWVAYRLAHRARRRAAARRAERDARWQALIAEARARDAAANANHNDRRPGTDTNALTTCQAIWNRTEETQ